MNIAIVGCGYVADFYGQSLASYPELQLQGVYDDNPRTAEAFRRRWPARQYESLQQLLADGAVEMVLNLTNPRSHFQVTRACLEAGKHVYSEKPLGLTPQEAEQLVRLAREKGLYLSAAPCSVLSGTAQTLWKAIREGAVGKVRLVYANFDDGMIAPRMSPWEWRNDAGAPWPAADEFTTGCTYEHAGYVLTWLGAFFGPARYLTSHASCLIPDKGIPVESMAPDFTVGCIEYDGGVVARVTCGLVAPRDKSITVVGDDGVLFVGNVRDDRAPVIVHRATVGRWKTALARRLRWLDRWMQARVQWPGILAFMQSPFPMVDDPRAQRLNPGKPVDFMRGPAELAAAIREKRECRLSGQFAVHIVEIVEALQYPGAAGARKEIRTTFPAIAPLEWAR